MTKLNNLSQVFKSRAPGQGKTRVKVRDGRARTKAEWYQKTHKNAPAFVEAVEAEKARDLRVQDSEVSVDARVISGRVLQIRRRVAEELLEKESPEVKDEIRRLVLEDSKQRGKGLVPGSPPYINRYWKESL